MVAEVKLKNVFDLAAEGFYRVLSFAEFLAELGTLHSGEASADLDKGQSIFAEGVEPCDGA